MKKYDPLAPDASMLCKLGSIAVHAEEGLSPSGHGFDIVALRALLDDPAVRDWLKAMQQKALVPIKRTARTAEPRP